MKLDSHQHFWRYNNLDYGWMAPATMDALKTDYLPADLAPLLAAHGLDGTVAVQARQSLAETTWLLALAEETAFIRGVVGWVDLCTAEIEAQLESFARFPKFRGVRHVVHDEPDDKFMLRPEFLRGIGHLRRFGLTYDLLIYPRHLPIALEVVRRFPDQRFVIDHIAKPGIREQKRDPWAAHIREIATCPNVSCKVSGMVTETHWKGWQPDDFRPYLDVIFACFGNDRLLFGSDWPVCLLSGSYGEVFDLVDSYARQHAPDGYDRIMGDNAANFYQNPP